MRNSLTAVSVCICTFNRERLLRQTLTRLAELVVPDGVSFELVVVDNNSTDGTARVIAEASTRLPVRSVVETTPGLASARNRAVAVATGDLLVWLDDDVLVEPEWLARYVAAARAHPDAALFGGPVRAHFEVAPPGWVLEVISELQMAYAIRDFPAEITSIDPDHLPFGANFAVRSEVHARIPFNPALGRIGRDGGCLSEETSFFEQALALGYEGRWLHDCAVQHIIPAERQTTAYLRSFFRVAGATPDSVAPSSPMFLGRPRWLWREWMQNDLMYRFTRFTAPPAQWVTFLRRSSFAYGALFGRTRSSR